MKFVRAVLIVVGILTIVIGSYYIVFLPIYYLIRHWLNKR